MKSHSPHDPQERPPSTEELQLTDALRIVPSSQDDDLSSYPSKRHLWVIMVGLFLGTLVMALDTMIITTPLPRITQEFHSLEDVGWYGSAYLLTLTVFQPSYGKMYRIFSAKLSYLVSVTIFEIGSVVCAASPSSKAFIVGRAVAGVGAAGVMQGGLCILAFCVPPKPRPIYISVLMSVYGIAGVCGPLLGGVITENWSWRGCFWINLPLGFITIITIAFFVEKDMGRQKTTENTTEKLRQFDIPGACLLIASASCLLLVLQWGGLTKAWSSSTIIGLLCTAAVLAAAFGATQVYSGENATIPPSYVKKRNILVGMAFLFFLYMPMQTHAYYLSFYFQAVLGTTPGTSGIRSIPTPVSFMVGTVVSGIIISRFGRHVNARPFPAPGWYSSAAKWAGYQIVAGLGVGAGVQVPVSGLHTVLNTDEIATGNAILVFCGQLGGAIAVSIAQNIFTNTIKSELPKLTDQISPQAVIAAGATEAHHIAPPGAVRDAIIKSYSIAVNHVFLFALVVVAVALVCSMFMGGTSKKLPDVPLDMYPEEGMIVLELQTEKHSER